MLISQNRKFHRFFCEYKKGLHVFKMKSWLLLYFLAITGFYAAETTLSNLLERFDRAWYSAKPSREMEVFDSLINEIKKELEELKAQEKTTHEKLQMTTQSYNSTQEKTAFIQKTIKQKHAELSSINEQQSKIMELMKDFDYLQDFIARTTTRHELKNTELRDLINKGRKITENLQTCYGTHFKIFFFDEQSKSEQTEGIRPVQIAKHTQSYHLRDFVQSLIEILEKKVGLSWSELYSQHKSLTNESIKMKQIELQPLQTIYEQHRGSMSFLEESIIENKKRYQQIERGIQKAIQRLQEFCSNRLKSDYCPIVEGDPKQMAKKRLFMAYNSLMENQFDQPFKKIQELQAASQNYATTVIGPGSIAEVFTSHLQGKIRIKDKSGKIIKQLKHYQLESMNFAQIVHIYSIDSVLTISIMAYERIAKVQSMDKYYQSRLKQIEEQIVRNITTNLTKQANYWLIKAQAAEIYGSFLCLHFLNDFDQIVGIDLNKWRLFFTYFTKHNAERAVDGDHWFERFQKRLQHGLDMSIPETGRKLIDFQFPSDDRGISFENLKPLILLLNNEIEI